MFERLRGSRTTSPQVLGVGLILIGLLMFIVVFFAAFPVLSDPVGAYDDWFPADEQAADEPIAAEEETPEGPTAAFRYVAETTISEPVEGSEEEPMATYRVTFEERSEPGDAEIATWAWDLGDGAESSRRSFEHVYEGPGTYPVRLDIEDENGETSKVEGEVEVPDEGRSTGTFENDELDLSGIEAAVEDAVEALEQSVDDTLGTVRDTSRNMGAVALFALAAIATTVVAWRVTRSGVMLLTPNQEMRLKVRSADMHVDIGKVPLVEAVEHAAAQEVEPELIDI